MNSQTARTAEYFRKNVGAWISAPELMLVGGKCRFRTSISECRRWYGMRIVNRQRNVKLSTGQTFRSSEYRYEAPGEGGTAVSAAIPDSQPTTGA